VFPFSVFRLSTIPPVDGIIECIRVEDASPHHPLTLPMILRDANGIVRQVIVPIRPHCPFKETLKYGGEPQEGICCGDPCIWEKRTGAKLNLVDAQQATAKVGAFAQTLDDRDQSNETLVIANRSRFTLDMRGPEGGRARAQMSEA